MSTDYRAIVCALLEGHSYRSIARECGCSSKTVAAVRRVVDENQWTLDRVQRFSDAEIQQWFPDSRYQRDSSFTAIDLDGVVTRMRSFREANPGKTFTVKVEHERYVRECETAGGKPYSYKQFAAYVSEFVKQNDLSWPLTHDPGRVMFVDWSGDKMLVGMPGDPDSFRGAFGSLLAQSLLKAPDNTRLPSTKFPRQQNKRRGVLLPSLDAMECIHQPLNDFLIALPTANTHRSAFLKNRLARTKN